MRGKSDAETGHWRIQMENSHQKTAFITSEGLYKFQLMLFGLCNAPATFQRLVQRMYTEGSRRFCSMCTSMSLCPTDLHQRIGLKLQPKKCIFWKPRIWDTLFLQKEPILIQPRPKLYKSSLSRPTSKLCGDSWAWPATVHALSQIFQKLQAHFMP